MSEQRMTSSDKAQAFLTGLQAEKGDLWGIIVHEVCVIKAMLMDMTHRGVPQEMRDRMIGFGAILTTALVRYGKLDGREGEIMQDVDKLLDISLLEAAEMHGIKPDENSTFFASAGDSTVH